MDENDYLEREKVKLVKKRVKNKIKVKVTTAEPAVVGYIMGLFDPFAISNNRGLLSRSSYTRIG